ncbi:hypothetical protein, partial [Pseudomonas viridiflava]|uniref:hypothetical protein n=1 Tax=Pseudomonas viridiflava TaxID=33069 RepID=UPI0013CF265F
VGASLALWDSYRAYNSGNGSLAVAYISVAVGNAAWGVYALGLSINPYLLIIGAVFALGGAIVANLLTDSDAELITRNGPFGIHFSTIQEEAAGRDDPFKHLSDP